VYFNIGGGSKLPGSSIDPTVNRLARYNMSGEDGDTKEDIVIHVHILRTIELKLNDFGYPVTKYYTKNP
jgi:hypothetical protein